MFAAGDATAFPIKQGGLAAQQADAVAEAIAAAAGVDLDPQPFRPILRGVLLTGGAARYLRADISGARRRLHDRERGVVVAAEQAQRTLPRSLPQQPGRRRRRRHASGRTRDPSRDHTRPDPADPAALVRRARRPPNQSPRKEPIMSNTDSRAPRLTPNDRRERRSSGCCSSPMPPSPTWTSCRRRCARSSMPRPRCTSSRRPSLGALPGSPTRSIGFGISPMSASTPCWATCTRSTPTSAGVAIRGSVLTVIADAVEEFRPDHILIALRSRRARQLAGAQADRAHRGALRPAADDLCGGSATGTRRSPTARCSSATTDPRTPGTPSNARASCSQAGARSW